MSKYKKDPDFDAWVASLPATHWVKYDISAARLGWDAHIKHNESIGNAYQHRDEQEKQA